MKSDCLFGKLTPVFAVVIGVVILFSPQAWAGIKYKVLHNFGSSGDGTLPYGPLVLDRKGNLYGLTFTGGTGQCSDYGCGVVFELTPQANGKWPEQILHDFTSGGDGSTPSGGLIFDGAGNLYGTTVGSPDGTPSTVFQLTPGAHGWNHTVLYDNGAGPGLLLDKSGNLYGAIGPGDYYGVGAIGELSSGSNGWTYTQLYPFCSQYRCEDGYGPPVPPIWDRRGNLYGTTTDGGIGQPACWTFAGCGVIFEMTPNGDGTWTYHILHRFASSATDGQTPYGGLVMDASGNFYGTTEYGGDKGNGTVFQFSFTGGRWKKTVLYDFPRHAEGWGPDTTLVFDKKGNLYGAGGGGNVDCGPYTCGTVFKLTPQKNGKWKYSVLHKFNSKDGAFPWGVIVDSKGNIFGTTENGGTYNSGVAFEITP